MTCPTCGEANAKETNEGIFQAAHVATHIGLDHAKHLSKGNPWLGIVALGGLWAANAVLEHLVEKTWECRKCGKTF